MARRIGDRATFAVDVGATATPGLRVVDLWVAGKRLTVDDNAAYVPSLSYYMRMEAQRVRQREVPPCPSPDHEPGEIVRLLQAGEAELRQRFWFMRWSEILDNVSTYAYLDDLVIAFEFWRETHPFPEDLGKVFAARIPPDKFAAIIEEAAELLATETV
jgi:hypothetical protein